MALVVKDRVQETTTTTGTGTITLAGAATGFQSFSAIGNGNTTYYAIVGTTQWEVGLGTYTSSGTTLSRDTVLASSTGSKIDLDAGTKNVFVTYPATESVYQDANNDAYSPQFATSNGLHLSNGTIGTSYTFPTGYNSVEAGDITISSGVTVTVPSSSRWVIV
jgi:hypothetical protein